MNDRPLSSFTAAELSDPTIAAATLGQLSGERPDLWPAILAHPNCYPQLTQYIHQRMASMPPPMVPPQLPYAQPGPYPGGPAPWQYPVGAPVGPPPKVANWIFAAQVALPVLGILGIVSVFLPLLSASAVGYSMGTVGFFSDHAQGIGYATSFWMFVAIAFGVVGLLVRRKWSRITAGIIGIVVGTCTPLALLILVPNAGYFAGISFGLGATLLFIISPVMIAAGIIALMPHKQPQPG